MLPQHNNSTKAILSLSKAEIDMTSLVEYLRPELGSLNISYMHIRIKSDSKQCESVKY